MPTAGKLFGAIIFTLVGFLAAEVMKPFLNGADARSYISEFSALVGCYAGWRVMGPRAEGTRQSAILGGLKTSFTLAIWLLMLFAIWEMLSRAVDGRYKTVTHAIEGIFTAMLEYGEQLVVAFPTIFVLAIGGVIGGIFTNWAAARWP